jgi:hypothetical protein
MTLKESCRERVAEIVGGMQDISNRFDNMLPGEKQRACRRFAMLKRELSEHVKMWEATLRL